MFFGVGMIRTPLNHKNKHNYTCFLIYKMSTGPKDLLYICRFDAV